MAYNAVPTLTTGDTWSAANANTYWRDNFAAGVPDIITAAGDLVYGTAANAAAPLAIGTPGKALISSSDGLPIWGSAGGVSNRQGGSATDWNVAGTTNYTVSDHFIQVGAKLQKVYSGGVGAGDTVTFPVSFAYKPIIQLTIQYSSGYCFTLPNIYITSVNANNFQYILQFSSAIGSDSYWIIHWMAIGPV